MDISEITGEQRPIGYWIKQLHVAIDRSIDDLLASEGLTRRHWQVMNVIARQPRTQADLDAELSPFLSAEQPSLRPVADGLRDRGWLTGDELLTLTGPGIRAHADIHDRVTVTRARVTEGISAEEYRATVDVLARMTANMGG
ncbi:MarR family winged helix-turn-helix transcriptional regulator [Streptosporangium sp. NPDC087985]|uniref:MarR family winged helix-turn-helix transcriptional regulator n=1 Tax=Streptosporangium sp. NPDC087985 TaxID=3366196 RepID=UPI00382F4839